MPADGTSYLHLATDIALAPYLATERQRDAVRSSVDWRPGVRWSGMDSAPTPSPRSEAQLLAAAQTARAAANSPRAHFIRAVKQLWQIGYAPEAAKLDGIYYRSLADARLPLDTAAVGAALLILNPIRGRDAEAARDALAELLIATRPALECAA